MTFKFCQTTWTRSIRYAKKFQVFNLFGFGWSTLGLREEELRNSSSSNPEMRDMLSNLEEMKMELKRLKSEFVNENK